MPEALWTLSGDDVLLPPPSDATVAAVLARLLRRVQRDWHDDDVWPDDEYEALQKRLALARESQQVESEREQVRTLGLLIRNVDADVAHELSFDELAYLQF